MSTTVSHLRRNEANGNPMFSVTTYINVCNNYYDFICVKSPWTRLETRLQDYNTNGNHMSLIISSLSLIIIICVWYAATLNNNNMMS